MIDIKSLEIIGLYKAYLQKKLCDVSTYDIQVGFTILAAIQNPKEERYLPYLILTDEEIERIPLGLTLEEVAQSIDARLESWKKVMNRRDFAKYIGIEKVNRKKQESKCLK